MLKQTPSFYTYRRSNPPEEGINLCRRKAHMQQLQSQLRRWPGEQSYAINLKATRTKSLAFLIFRSMEGNMLPTCSSGWYVGERMNLFYSSTSQSLNKPPRRTMIKTDWNTAVKQMLNCNKHVISVRKYTVLNERMELHYFSILTSAVFTRVKISGS